MLTLEQVLNNNTKEEGVRIIISSAEQYKEFMIFLDKNSYIWSTGKRLIDHCPFGDFEELTEFYLPLNFMIISLHKNITVTYGDFFTLDGCLDEGYFCENCDYFFTHEKEILYKPYAYLKREIAQCTGIEEW